MAVVSLQARSNVYRAVHAVSVTGLFPGFARPHFVPENLHGGGTVPNTLYVQRVVDEQIVAFDPVEEIDFQRIILPHESEAAVVSVGDAAIYSYAFGPKDIVVGARSVVQKAIKNRFKEIEPREFAACTAAQFARLYSRLPEVNSRAFSLLAKSNPFAARQWRDSTVFMNTLRDKLHALQVSQDSVRLHSRNRAGTLEVTLSLVLDGSYQLDRSQIESDCRRMLNHSGLFSEADTFILRIESSTTDGSPVQLRLIEPPELDHALRDAKLFLEEKVFLPALRWSNSSRRTLNVVRDTRHWISRFQKIGDLVRYMDRFRPDTRQSSLPFMEIRQIRFEDVYVEFATRFGRYRGFATGVADFKEGKRYSAFALSIYTRTYSNRGAGIRSVGKLGSHEAVVVNVTVGSGKYRNEWLSPGERLKCYLKAPVNRDESHHEEALEANQAIMKYPHIPVLVFTRQSEEPDYLYHGVFRYTQIGADDGGKWFDLMKLDTVASH